MIVSLIELREATDRIQLLFRYPTKTRLSQLIREIKVESFNYFKQEFPAIANNLTSENELWSQAYLIASCDRDFLHNYQTALILAEKD